MTACTNEILVDSYETEKGQDVILLRTRMTGMDMEDPENKLHTLRLYIFVRNGDQSVLAVNRIFQTTDAASALSGDAYFVKDDDGYTISQLLQKSIVKVMVIANELTPMDGVTTETGVLTQQVNFYNQYSPSGKMDIKTDKGIPMFASTGWLAPSEWSFKEGKVIELTLIRTLAKITLRISKDVDRKETFTYASIYNIPQFTVMGDSISAYSSSLSLVHTASQPIVFSGANVVSNDLQFYVPEFVVSKRNKENNQYAYIHINANSNTVENALFTYKIPLGNGVQSLYGSVTNGDGTVSGENALANVDEAVQKLSLPDLKISRNKQYDFTVWAKAASGGHDTGDMSVTTRMKEWSEQLVNGDINPPSLVLSSIDWLYKNDASLNRIYYWSNVKVELLPDIEICDKQGNFLEKKSTAENVFEKALVLTAVGEGPVAGYLDVKLSAPWLLVADKIIKVTFNAGGLKKAIIIRPPLVKN